MGLLDTARTWWNLGYTPVPIRTDGSKAPAVKWKQYQQGRPTLAELEHLFSTDTDGIGLITGATSGNLEMAEAEGRAVTEGILTKLAQAFADHDATDLWARITNGYAEITPSGGVHWYYRIAGTVTGNTKLARRPSTPAELEDHKQVELAKLDAIPDPDARQRRAAKIHQLQPEDVPQVLLETRGEGGFTVVAPSAGRTHPTGRPWVTITGSPETIPTITEQERDLIHAVCALLDQMPENMPANIPAPTVQRRQASTPTEGHGQRPGDAWAAQTTWDDILTPHGWTVVHNFPDGGRAWRRPGKRDGISASTERNGLDNLLVFSSSTPFDTDVPISKLMAHAILNHNSDLSAAVRALAADGYGDPLPDPTLTLIRTSEGHATDPIPELAGTTALRLDRPDSDIPQSINATLTDQGNADLLATTHASTLKYVPSRGQWLTWTNTKWSWCDDTGEATQAAVNTLRRIDTRKDEVYKHVTRSLSKRGLEAMVSLAAKHPAMRVTAAQLDADPWVLNTPGGLINLHTGTSRPLTSTDLCTRSTNVAPDHATPPTRWLEFLTETFGGDPALISYIQRLAGNAAAGTITHHILPFLHGGGGNGKSVFLDVLTTLLGDYASTAPPNFLMAGRQDESAIARLDGLRLVVCSEVSQSAKFDEAKVKLLTGGDKITARFLYGKHFTFTPSASLWLMGNHQPRVEAGGESFWRRLRLIPFTRTVPKERRVEALAQQLVDTEGPSILAWIIEGAKQCLDQGMNEPDSVIAATATYAEEEDALARFVSERCHLGGADQVRTPTAEVRAAYASWCRSEGETEVSAQVFGRELRARWGIKTGKSNGTRHYLGLTLYADDQEPEEETWWQK